MVYDYKEAIKKDILDFIDEDIDFLDWETTDDLKEFLLDETYSCVTGVQQNSYTCSSQEASENLNGNFKLLIAALPEDFLKSGRLVTCEEEADIAIRCYLFEDCLNEVMDLIEDEFEAAHKEYEDLL